MRRPGAVLRCLPGGRLLGLVTKHIQGAKGYAQLRKEDLDRRFPGLLDSIINADAPALV